MRLYHFTGVTLAEAILSDMLRLGHLPTESGEILNGIVWLTSFPDPHGTGVPAKAERLSASKMAYSSQVTGKTDGSNLSYDKSRIRLTIESDALSPYTISNDRATGLISFEQWCKQAGMSKIWTKYMGLSAVMDVNNMTDDEKLRQMKKKGNTKEHTWYLHFGPIPVDLITTVEYRTGRSYEPYQFEKHGRDEYSQSGFACLSEETNLKLREIVPPANHHEHPKVSVLCQDPEGPIVVIVRGGGTMYTLNGTNGEVLMKGKSEYPLEEVQEWVLQQRDEIEHRWGEAVESYYYHYPEKRKTP